MLGITKQGELDKPKSTPTAMHLIYRPERLLRNLAWSSLARGLLVTGAANHEVHEAELQLLKRHAAALALLVAEVDLLHCLQLSTVSPRVNLALVTQPALLSLAPHTVISRTHTLKTLRRGHAPPAILPPRPGTQGPYFQRASSISIASLNCSAALLFVQQYVRCALPRTSSREFPLCTSPSSIRGTGLPVAPLTAAFDWALDSIMFAGPSMPGEPNRRLFHAALAW